MACLALQGRNHFFRNQIKLKAHSPYTMNNGTVVYIWQCLHISEPVLQLVRDAPTQSISLRLPQDDRPSSPKRADSPGTTSEQTIERLFSKRRQTSPKSKKKKITVNQRPYSASTYVQLLKSPYMQKTVPSPKVLNKLMRPQSGGARLGWSWKFCINWCAPKVVGLG